MQALIGFAGPLAGAVPSLFYAVSGATLFSRRFRARFKPGRLA